MAAISVLLLGAALLVGNLLRRVLAGFSPFFGLVAALVPSFLVLSVALKNEYLKKDGATDLLSLVKFYAPVIFAAFMCGLSLGIYGLSVAAFWATIGCPCGVALGLLIKAEKSERLERTAQFLAALCYFAAGVSLIVNDMLVTWR
ncbi:MAG: hypothetical protein KBS41_02710 [Oscillospiraceae bacterium]|nr:hypothetical protein [Candidatus Equicaccousia limihippi]